MNKGEGKKVIILGIIMLFIGTYVLPCEKGYVNENKEFNEKILFSNWAHHTSLKISPPTSVNDYQVKINLDSQKVSITKL